MCHEELKVQAVCLAQMSPPVTMSGIKFHAKESNLSTRFHFYWVYSSTQWQRAREENKQSAFE
jgi:uncharacterized membrane protein